MEDQYLVELEYQNFLAKEELFDRLSELSECFQLPLLTEAQVELLNEMSFNTVGVYVTKVINNIQKAWNNFKTGYNDSTWASYKQVNGRYFNSSLEMKTPEGMEVPLLDKIDQLMRSVVVPKWVDDSPMFKDKESFLKNGCHAPDLYNKDKGIFEIISETHFKTINNSMIVNSGSLKSYINFMDTYSTKYDKLAEDIKNINISSKEVTAAAKDMQRAKEKAEEKKKKDEEKAKREAEEAKKKEEQEAKANAEKAKAEAEKSTTTSTSSNSAPEVHTDAFIFNTAAFLLETFLLREEEEKTGTSKQSPGTVTRDATVKQGTKTVNTPEDNKSDDDELNAKLETINIYFTSASELLSAKMKCLTKARNTSLKLIKNYCKIASKQNKEAKKKAKEDAKNASKEESGDNTEVKI